MLDLITLGIIAWWMLAWSQHSEWVVVLLEADLEFDSLQD
jgi:hypothetical protein